MEKKGNVVVPTKIVGIFEKSKNFGFVKPDDKKNFKKDIFIPKAFSKNARNGQKVVVEIIKESVDGKKSEGKIVEILGFPDQAGIDMLSIIKQFDLPSEFSKEVINEAKSVSLEPISLKYRRDLRDQEIFTIDGEDAKDLDDAVCVKKYRTEIMSLECILRMLVIMLGRIRRLIGKLLIGARVFICLIELYRCFHSSFQMVAVV